MSRPTKILFLAANPKDTTQLLLDEEIRQISQRIRRAEYRKLFTFESAPALRATDLPFELMDRQPDIVHFSGHGSTSGELYLLADELRLSQPVSAEILGDLFRPLSAGIKCVVLNACDSRPQAEAIVSSVPCVIAMSRAMPDTAAVAFAAGFYEALAFGKTVAEAVELGRLQVRLAEPHLAAHATTPILLTQPGVEASQYRIITPQAVESPAQPTSVAEAKPQASASQTLHFGNIVANGGGNQIRINQSRRSGLQGETKMQGGDITVGGQGQSVSINQNVDDKE